MNNIAEKLKKQVHNLAFFNFGTSLSIGIVGLCTIPETAGWIFILLAIGGIALGIAALFWIKYDELEARLGEAYEELADLYSLNSDNDNNFIKTSN